MVEENLKIEDSNKKKGKKKILILVFVLLPILTILIYMASTKVLKGSSKGFLTSLPGPIGRHFQKVPTEAENQNRVNYLADYFLSEEASVSADKMYIIKKEDEKVYRKILRQMNIKSPEKTEEVVLKIRDLELRKDLLMSVYDDVKEDKRNKFRSEVSRIESQETLLSKMEIESKFAIKEFQETIKSMKPQSLAKILYFVDPTTSSYIIGLFDNNTRTEINTELNKIGVERENLKDLAKYYETKTVDEAIEFIGNTDTYTIEELAIIYNNMSVAKSSEILSKVKDGEFIENLFLNIKKEEELLGTNYNIARDISRSIDFFNEYNKKVEKLRKVYGDMNPKQVADITSAMIKNNKTITIFNLDIDEIYDLSDRTIIIDILSGVKKDQLSKVLDVMDAKDATRVTELLATPIVKTLKGGEKIDK